MKKCLLPVAPMTSVLEIARGGVESRVSVCEGCMWGACGPSCVNPTVTLCGLEIGRGHHSEGTPGQSPGVLLWFRGVPGAQTSSAKTKGESGPPGDCGHHSTAMGSLRLVTAILDICVALAPGQARSSLSERLHVRPHNPLTQQVWPFPFLPVRSVRFR